jgi:hypothetical protein
MIGLICIYYIASTKKYIKSGEIAPSNAGFFGSMWGKFHPESHVIGKSIG